MLVGGQGTGRGSLVTERAVQGLRSRLRVHARRARDECSAELIGEKQENASEDKSCLYNSGVTFRTGYQVNIGRREAGEFIGIVVHRKAPGAIRGNVLWLDRGDEKFPGLRKKEDWNRLRISAKGPQLTVRLNGKQICDVKDDPDRSRRSEVEGGRSDLLQWPHVNEPGFTGFVKYRNMRIREL